MTDKPMKAILDSIARRGTPDNPDLWPEIRSRLAQRRTVLTALRARPLAAILLVVLVILLLTGAAYAIGVLTRYIPGIGFVEQSSLRVLAEPVSQTRLGVTVTIEQVAADAERTVVVYKAEGLTIQAANSRGEGGGPSGFGSKHLLRLPDGRTLDEIPSMGYGGTPEPILDQVQTEGGWPNYVYRLVYPAVDPRVNELTLVIPVLENMPAGAAPENWEITFRLKTSPPEMTFAPVFQLTPQAGATGSPLSGTTEAASSSNSSSRSGFTLRLDNVIETLDGYLFTGDLSWDTSIFPTGNVALSGDVAPTLTDAAGQNVPIEAVQMDAPHVEGHWPWSYRTNRKAFAGPLTFSIPSIQATVFAPTIDFEIDLGPAPQIGQAWQFNHDFQVGGHTLRLLSVQLRGPMDSCSSAALEFNFKADAAGMTAFVSDANPEPPSKQGCGGGGGGGGGPVDPTLSSSAVSYGSLPRGPHRFSILAAVPHLLSGPWQVTWQPPTTSVVTMTAEREACLTGATWQQALDRLDPLPSGVGGKILTTVNEGGLLPAIYAQALDGRVLGKFDSGSWPSLSPDGTHLVYGAGDALHVLDLTDGRETSFLNDGYAHHGSPDNKRLLYTTTFGLYVINADGTGLQKIDTGPAQVISVVGWLPDNQTIVYGAMGGSGFAFTSYNLQSGESKRLFTIQNKAGYGALSPDGAWIVFADRIFGANNWGIFISRLDGSDRIPVAAPDVPTAFTSVWGPGNQWLILNTRTTDGKDVPVLVNPFTCQAVKLDKVNGMVESWSP